MELRETDFEELVLDSDRPVLVDFWASWCPPCKMMQPVMDKLSVKVSDWADVYSVNIDRKTGALTEGQMLKLLQMVYRLLEHLPADRDYRVIFMRRDVDEILQSQKTMLQRNGIETDVPDSTMKAMFERQLRQFYAWLPSQSHLRLINVSYNELLARPENVIIQINRHLNGILQPNEMLSIIDPDLYRHRAA
jgi:thiol-disulfide isomerase/thioredoxin